MKPHTERLQKEFEDVVRQTDALVARLDDGALQRRPSESAWSVTECIDHLSATAEMFTRRIRRALDAATVRSADPREKLSFLGGLYVRFLEPPVRRLRVPIPTAKLAPSAILPSREELLRRFHQSHADLQALLLESDPFDRSKLRAATPASKRITVTLLDGFSALTAHARRHLWQAERTAARQ